MVLGGPHQPGVVGALGRGVGQAVQLGVVEGALAQGQLVAHAVVKVVAVGTDPDAVNARQVAVLVELDLRRAHLGVEDLHAADGPAEGRVGRLVLGADAEGVLEGGVSQPRPRAGLVEEELLALKKTRFLSDRVLQGGK